MKKSLIIFCVLSTLAQSKDYQVTLGTKVELKNTQLNYTPIDLKIKSKDNKYSFNVELKGNRDDLKKPNEKYNYKEKKFASEISKLEVTGGLINSDNFTSGTKYLVLDDDVDFEKQRISRLFRIYEPYKLSDNDHDHSHSHSEDNHNHEHSHDGHDHDHSHDHEHDKMSDNKKDFVIENYRNHTKHKDNDDLMAKFQFVYRPDKLSNYGLKFYPTAYYEYNSRLPKNTFDFSLNNSYLINNKNAILYRGNLLTHSFVKPLLLKFKTEYRAKLNNNNFLSIGYDNANQLNVLKERLNTKNSIYFVYDHNKEKIRFHEFYEYVDHEHEKLQQAKFEIKYTDHINHLKNITESVPLKYDLKNRIKKYDLNLTLSKRDFLLNELNIKNVFNINYENEKRQYAVDKDINTGANQFEGLNSKYELYENNLYKIDEKDVDKYRSGVIANKDKSEGIRYNLYKNDKGEWRLNERKYRLNNRYKDLGDIRVIKDDYNLSNKLDIEYKGFRFEDKFNYSKYNPENVTKLENDLKLSFEKKFGNYLVAKPIFENSRIYTNEININEKNNNKIFVKYYQNRLKKGMDLALLYKQNGLNIKLGVLGAFEKNDYKYKVEGLFNNYVDITDNQQRKQLVGEEYYKGVEKEIEEAKKNVNSDENSNVMGSYHGHNHHHHHHHHNFGFMDMFGNGFGSFEESEEPREETGVETDIKTKGLAEYYENNFDLDDPFPSLNNQKGILVNQVFNNTLILSPYIKAQYKLNNKFSVDFEAMYEMRKTDRLIYFNYSPKNSHDATNAKNKEVKKNVVNKNNISLKLGLKYTF